MAPGGRCPSLADYVRGPASRQICVPKFGRVCDASWGCPPSVRELLLTDSQRGPGCLVGIVLLWCLKHCVRLQTLAGRAPRSRGSLGQPPRDATGHPPCDKAPRGPPCPERGFYVIYALSLAISSAGRRVWRVK